MAINPVASASFEVRAAQLPAGDRSRMKGRKKSHEGSVLCFTWIITNINRSGLIHQRLRRWWLRASSHAVNETSCENSDPYQDFGKKVTKTARVKLISPTIRADVIDCKSCPVHMQKIRAFMLRPCRFTCCLMVFLSSNGCLYAAVLRLTSYSAFSQRNHVKDNLVSPAERQTLIFCLFYL